MKIKNILLLWLPIILFLLYIPCSAFALSYSQEVLADNPVTYWRLGETSGTTAFDSGSAATNGTYVGSPSLGVTGALVGDSNKAITITGPSNYVSVPGFSLGSNYTAEVWVKINSFNHGRHYIFDLRNGGGPWFFIDKVNATDGEINIRGASGGGDSIFFPTATFVDGSWHHLAFSVSDSGTILYFDGNQIASSTIKAATGFGSGGRLGAYISQPTNDSDHWFNGSLDEFAFYNAPLSQERILTHYNTGFNSSNPIPEPAPFLLLGIGLIFTLLIRSFLFSR